MVSSEAGRVGVRLTLLYVRMAAAVLAIFIVGAVAVIVVVLTARFLPLPGVMVLVLLFLASSTYALITRVLPAAHRAWKVRRAGDRISAWQLLAVRPHRGRLLWAGLLGAALVAGLLPLAGQLQPAPRSVAYTVGRVASSDGTTIGYRILGHGPGLVLVHGGMMAAQNFMKLGEALAEQFTVYIPDRRGRGLSGSPRVSTLHEQVQDIQAVLRATGSRYLFGLSAGAVIALQTALDTPSVQRLAIYEPPIPVAGSSTAWLPRYDREIAEGHLAAAMITAARGTGDSSLLLDLPRFLSERVMELALDADAAGVAPGNIPLKDLVPTMHTDALLVAESAGLVDRSRHLTTPTLLIGGDQSPAILRQALDALAAQLPHARRIELKGVGHLAADNDEAPDRVAEALLGFFTVPARP